MKVSRREFIGDVVSAFTLTFAAPAFLADIARSQGSQSRKGRGWLGRYLHSTPLPDTLVAWNTTGETPGGLLARTVGVPAIPDARTYSFSSPNSGAEALNERAAATQIASHVPVDRPHLAFVNGTARGALETLDRVASVANYTGTVTYPNNGFALALRTVAGSIVRGIGTRVFWVQTGGDGTHSTQGVTGGGYGQLLGTLGGRP